MFLVLISNFLRMRSSRFRMANSPDLNPMENLLTVPKRKVSQHDLRVVEDLKSLTTHEWKAVLSLYCEYLISSMTTHTNLVLGNESNPIHTSWVLRRSF